MNHAEEWRLLRIKTDENTNDVDWVTDNTEPDADTLCDTMPSGTNAEGKAYTGIEYVLIGTNDAGVIQSRTATPMTFSVSLIEVFSRSDPNRGGTVGFADAIVDSDVHLLVPLQGVDYFDINGGRQFTIRLFDDANDVAAVERVEIWWRAVAR